jgi:hypothetical protein
MNEGISLSELAKKLDDHEKRISTLEGIPIPKSQNKKLSIKEFLLSKKPSDDVQKTLAIGYYFEQFESMTSFNSRDLADGFRTAKEPPPQNINDKVNLNIRKGHIMEAKEPKDNLKSWVLTHSGEKFVEGNFESD